MAVKGTDTLPKSTIAYLAEINVNGLKRGGRLVVLTQPVRRFGKRR
jgi:hypothetical protein